MIDAFITPNFSLSEFVESDTATRLALGNTPTPEVLSNLRLVLIPGMQAIRDLLAVPVIIKSGYRGRLLNAAVRGAPSSQHITGNAADFVAPAFGSPKIVCEYLVRNMDVVKFDQLIQEGTWVHVSFANHRRNEVLTAHFSAAGVSYTRGLA